MVIVDSITAKVLIPGRGFDIFAAILFPFDVGPVAQDAGAFFGHVCHAQKGADVEAHTVVEVRVPADGLFGQRLPAHKDVVGRFAGQNQFQPFFERFCRGQTDAGAVDAVGQIALLACDPVAQVGVDQRAEQLGVEFVIVDQGGKTIGLAVPDVPDKGALLEELAMLAEKGITAKADKGLVNEETGKRYKRPRLARLSKWIRGKFGRRKKAASS